MTQNPVISTAGKNLARVIVAAALSPRRDGAKVLLCVRNGNEWSGWRRQRAYPTPGSSVMKDENHAREGLLDSRPRLNRVRTSRVPDRQTDQRF